MHLVVVVAVVVLGVVVVVVLTVGVVVLGVVVVVVLATGVVVERSWAGVDATRKTFGCAEGKMCHSLPNLSQNGYGLYNIYIYIYIYFIGVAPM
jgi:hypothetical protein